MLVSLMARLNAIRMRNDAQYAMMCNRQNMMCAIRNLPAFCGDMRTLAQMDQQFALKNAQNQTMYLLADAQEKAAAHMLKNDIQGNKISYIA